MHLYLQLTRSLAVTLIWIYCNKLVLRYVRLRVSDPSQVSIPQPGIVTMAQMKKKIQKYNNNNYIEYVHKHMKCSIGLAYKRRLINGISKIQQNMENFLFT